MELSSKEITIIIIQTIMAIVIAIITFTSDKFKQLKFTDPIVIYVAILLIAILLLVIIWSTNKKITELSEKQEKKVKELSQELNNKITKEELDKRFKTLEELNDIRLDIRELQKEVLNKNGKKK